MAKIYMASSWRNAEYPKGVETLRRFGHEVYDWRNPPDGSKGFRWSAIDPDWMDWDPKAYRKALASPIAIAGFNSDFTGMKWADVCILLLPCGRSAHLEAGWMVGAGKHTIIFTCAGQEPELMALLAHEIVTSWSELRFALEHYDNNRRIYNTGKVEV